MIGNICEKGKSGSRSVVLIRYPYLLQHVGYLLWHHSLLTQCSALLCRGAWDLLQEQADGVLDERVLEEHEFAKLQAVQGSNNVGSHSSTKRTTWIRFDAAAVRIERYVPFFAWTKVESSCRAANQRPATKFVLARAATPGRLRPETFLSSHGHQTFHLLSYPNSNSSLKLSSANPSIALHPSQ